MDMEKFRPLDRAACRERLGMPSGAPIVFFSGRPAASYKGFALARATYEIVERRLPGALLVTAGSIPYDEMPLYFNAADVVLQTSFCEASPTVVKEALACEVPLVSTDVGDTREITSGVPYCFVCPSNPVELADRVLDCIGHRAAGGREQLLAKRIALNQVTARVIEVYRQLM
jgi:glycosyltransferase involved in cell wall biosynthesis